MFLTADLVAQMGIIILAGLAVLMGIIILMDLAAQMGIMDLEEPLAAVPAPEAVTITAMSCCLL